MDTAYKNQCEGKADDKGIDWDDSYYPTDEKNSRKRERNRAAHNADNPDQVFSNRLYWVDGTRGDERVPDMFEALHHYFLFQWISSIQSPRLQGSDTHGRDGGRNHPTVCRPAS